MEVTQPTGRASINYRDSLPGAPKPVCARQSFDETMFHEMYAAEHDAIMAKPNTKTTTSSPPRRADSMQKQQQQLPPALPQKSSLRTSRVLDAVSLKLDEVSESGRLSQSTAPHEVYLSSEEDASSSADDFSDYDFDSESEQSEPPASRKRSYEDIAKMVPLYFGKPTVVNITTVRRSHTPSSMGSGNDSRSATPNPSPPLRSSSTIPISSSAAPAAASFNHPPRSTSFSGAFLLNSNHSQHSFLSIDPYATKSPTTTEDAEPSRASKTPSSSSMLKKTLGLVRKRSRPNLTTNLPNSSMGSLTSSATSLSPQNIHSPGESPMEPRARTRSSTLSLLKTQPPVTYQDIMRNAKRNAATASTTEPSTPKSPVPVSPMSPMSPRTAPPEKKSRLLSGLSMAKRMSVRTGH